MIFRKVLKTMFIELDALAELVPKALLIRS